MDAEAGISTEDLTLDHTSSRVTLLIKMSKANTVGKGVERMLQRLCAGHQCKEECPCLVSQEVLGKVEKYSGTDPRWRL